MKFRLIDSVLERSEGKLVALKQVSAAEEYLQDHFPTFPVLPGVMMLEAMVQASRELIEPGAPASAPLVLSRVRALKYGQFAKPGDALRVEVELAGTSEDGSFDIKGKCLALLAEAQPDETPRTACAGRLTLRRARLTTPVVGGA